MTCQLVIGREFCLSTDGRKIMQPTSCEGRRGFAPILEVFQGGDILIDDLVSCKRVYGDDCLDLGFLGWLRLKLIVRFRFVTIDCTNAIVDGNHTKSN